MAMNKVFIIYHDDELVNNYVEQLLLNNDFLTCASKFSTNKEEENNEVYYMSPIEVNLAIKNNALLYVVTSNYVSRGVTMDDFYNNDICLLHYNEYNIISDVLFSKYNILTIWIDSKKKLSVNDLEMYEIDYVEQRLEHVPNEYFLNDKFEDINKCIINHINKAD